MAALRTRISTVVIALLLMACIYQCVHNILYHRTTERVPGETNQGIIERHFQR